MHIVAIYNLPKEKEALAATLAATLGATVYEALARLKSPGQGPFVVGVSAASEQAEELCRRLGTNGFDAFLLKAGEIESGEKQLIVRKFMLGENKLTAESGPADRLEVDYTGIYLIIRGTSMAQTTTTESIKQNKFSPATAILSGGLKMTQKTEKIVESTTQHREGFFLLYSRDQKTLLFRENGLVYDSFGPALRTTRQANFSYLLEELRRRGPQACYDDRLLTRAGQTQLLGPSLNPEKYLDVATSLLAKLLR